MTRARFPIYCVVFTALFHTYAGPAVEEPVAAISISSLAGLAGASDKIAAAFMPPGHDKFPDSPVEGMLASARQSGIDTSKQLRIFLLQAGADTGNGSVLPPIFPVFAIPVPLDDHSFLKTIESSFEERSETNGITRLSGPKPGMRVPETLFLTVADGLCIASPSEAATANLAGNPACFNFDVHPGMEGVLRILINPQALSRILPGIINNPVNMQAGHEGQIKALASVMQQFKTMEAAIAVTGNGIELTCMIMPQPDSALAEFTRAPGRISDRFISILPANALFASAGTGMDILNKINGLHELQYAFMGGSQAIAETTRKIQDTYTGEFASGILPGKAGTTLGMVEIVAIRDEAETSRLVSDYFEAMAGAGDSGIISGIIPSSKRSFSGTTIWSGKCTLPGNPGLPSGQILASWLEKACFETAVLENKIIYTFGDRSVMDEAIAAVKAGSGNRIDASPFFTRTFGSAHKNAVKIFAMSISGMVRQIMASILGIDPAIMAFMQAQPMETGGYSVILNGGIYSRMIIGMQELQTIGSATSMALAGMMAAGGDIMPNRRAEECVENLSAINDAKQTCATQLGLKPGDAIPMDALLRHMKDGEMPECPSAGEYSINPVGQSPSCNIPGHSLEF